MAGTSPAMTELVADSEDDSINFGEAIIAPNSCGTCPGMTVCDGWVHDRKMSPIVATKNPGSHREPGLSKLNPARSISRSS
jgi:hypothetical protein